jgi:hypothetical protein
MIEAAIRGKVDVLRVEDALTSVAFGRLRYLPAGVLTEWLESARDVRGRRLALPRVERLDDDAITLWPYWADTYMGAGGVIPDAYVRIGDVAVVIETKLWSGKSSHEDDTPAHASGDQLAREWRAAVDAGAPVNVRPIALVYVTATDSLPRGELEASERASLAKGLPPAFFWTSWSDLARVLLPLRESADMAAVVARDLFAYLDAALGFGATPFAGWGVAASACLSVPGVAWNYATSTSPPDTAVDASAVSGRERYFDALPSVLEFQVWEYRGMSSDGDGIVRPQGAYFTAPQSLHAQWTYVSAQQRNP